MTFPPWVIPVRTRRMLARPFTRPDSSTSTTRPWSRAPFSRTLVPFTARGAARVAENESPGLFVLELRASESRTFNTVSEGTVRPLGAGTGAGSAAAFVGGTAGATAAAAGLSADSAVAPEVGSGVALFGLGLVAAGEQPPAVIMTTSKRVPYFQTFMDSPFS